MHTYYQEHMDKLKAEMGHYLSPIVSELEAELVIAYSELFGEAWTCCREEMLEYMPDICNPSYVISGPSGSPSARRFYEMRHIIGKRLVFAPIL